MEEGSVGRGVGGEFGSLEVEVGVVEEGFDGGGLGAAGVDEIVAAGDPVVYSVHAVCGAGLGLSVGGGRDYEEDEGFEKWGSHGQVWCGSESDSGESVLFFQGRYATNKRYETVIRNVMCKEEPAAQRIYGMSVIGYRHAGIA